MIEYIAANFIAIVLGTIFLIAILLLMPKDFNGKEEMRKVVKKFKDKVDGE